MNKAIQTIALLAAIIALAPARAGDPDKPTPTPAPDAQFQANSHWTGTQLGDERKANSRALAATFNVTERNGDKFVAEYWVVGDQGRRGLKLEGTVDKSGNFTAQPTKVLAGNGWPTTIMEDSFSGQVEGGKLVVEYKNRKNGAVLRAELEFKNDRSKRGGGGKKGSQG